MTAGDVTDASSLLPADPPIQLLDERGELVESADYPLDLKDDGFRDLYRAMVVARRVDQQATALQRQGQLAVYPPLVGQEAAQVGSAYALVPQDWVFTSYREMAVALVRGVDLVSLFQLWRGTWLSDHDPRQTGFGLLTISVGTHVLHAAGYAMAARLDGADVVAMAYFGDGATSAGDVHEAMNFAAVYEAPCVFNVQNNHYAISVPVTAQSKAPTLAHRAIAYGMPGERYDGNDVLASYAVTRHAVERARAGEGPGLVEAVTYRVGPHTTADDPTRYRPAGEAQEWGDRDPLTRFETFVDREGLLDADDRAGISEEAEAQAVRLREEFTVAEAGDPLELFDHVYVNPPASYAYQRDLVQRQIDRETR